MELQNNKPALLISAFGSNIRLCYDRYELLSNCVVPEIVFTRSLHYNISRNLPGLGRRGKPVVSNMSDMRAKSMI